MKKRGIECKLIQRSLFMHGSFERAPALKYSFMRWRSEQFLSLFLEGYISWVCSFIEYVYIVDFSLERCVTFCCFRLQPLCNLTSALQSMLDLHYVNVTQKSQQVVQKMACRMFSRHLLMLVQMSLLS